MMKVTKKSVVVTTTNMIHGMLEHGGLMGLVVAYPLPEAIVATGLSAEELAAADADDLVDGCQCTIHEVLNYTCPCRVIRRGTRIE